MDKLAAAPSGPASHGMIENVANGSLVRVLSPEAAEAFRGTLRQRRQEVALAIVEGVPANAQGLAALPQVATAIGTSKADLVGDAEQADLQAAIVQKQTVAGAAVPPEKLAPSLAPPVAPSALR